MLIPKSTTERHVRIFVVLLEMLHISLGGYSKDLV